MWCRAGARFVGYRVPAGAPFHLTTHYAAPRTQPSSLAQQVRDLGTRDSASDGLAVDNTGRLYLTSLQHSGIQRATSLSTVASGVETLTRDDREMVWPDTIGWVRVWA